MKKMSFKYSDAPQRSEEWTQLGLGKPTASNLYRWKRYNSRSKEPKLLKTAVDYEKELMFERQFGQQFSKFVNDAMIDGINYEAFARAEYERITGNTVVEVGCWYNDYFRASPDGDVILKGSKKPTGSLEIKWLKDTNWTEVLESGKPFVGNSADHWKQCQGQMFANGRKWTDYAACNETTKKVIILRVKADPEYFKELEASLREPLTVDKFKLKNVHDLSSAPLPEAEMLVQTESTASKELKGF